MGEVLIRIETTKRTLCVPPNSRTAILLSASRISWVSPFLGLPNEAVRRDVALDEVMLQRAFAALRQLPALNRATLSQLVREAGRLLDVARSKGADAGQLSFGPRAMTTGSWHPIILRCR